MFRVSMWVLLGVIAAAMLAWVLKGGTLEGKKVAGWTDFGTWGWHQDDFKSTTVTEVAKTAPTVPTPQAEPAPAPAPPPVAEAEPQAPTSPPAEVAAEVPVESVGVPHGEPWPIATEVPNWADVMKVREPATEVAEATPEPAAEPAVSEESAASDTSAAADSAPAATGTETSDAVGVAHPFPWPIATEVPNWNITVTAGDTSDAPAAAPAEPATETAAPASDSAEGTAVGVPSPLPWPIATEVPNWNITVPSPDTAEAPAAAPEPASETPSAEAAAEPASPAEDVAVGVPSPLPWPISTELPKWEFNIATPAPEAPPAAKEDERRAELTPEQTACEDELRRIYKAGVIQFKSDSATIDDKSTDTLSKLAQAAKGCSKIRIRVEGHTDSRGPSAFNQALSERRAKAVAAYLAGAGVDAGSITANGYGKDRPIVPNDSEANRAKNRRIEFTVY